ncbi:DinB family protein [Robertmurraya massiliosenegalensis]|uniref:DinB family protein n=1 Tax=Robertmurraya massiliosenegalensis TaxID=1287657 RepID=UPI0002F489AC|nr:DinB family protein [Robertmurraya massiliosenegalensis]
MNKRQEILFNQLETYRSEILEAIKDVNEKKAEFIPPGFNNNIRWNLGHIYLDQYLWIQAVTKEKADVPAGFHKWFGYGTSPSNFTSETPKLEELKILLQNQPNEIRNRFGDRLEEVFEATEMGMHTIEQVLIRTIFHEGMHLQVILNIKKFL